MFVHYFKNLEHSHFSTTQKQLIKCDPQIMRGTAQLDLESIAINQPTNYLLLIYTIFLLTEIFINTPTPIYIFTLYPSSTLADFTEMIVTLHYSIQKLKR